MTFLLVVEIVRFAKVIFFDHYETKKIKNKEDVIFYIFKYLPHSVVYKGHLLLIKLSWHFFVSINANTQLL